jgi:hypothetical protein
MITKF